MRKLRAIVLAVSLLGVIYSSASILPAWGDFETAINLSASAGDSFEPQVAMSGSSTVYTVWRDITPGNYDIHFKKSTNGGASFDTAINLSNNAGTSTVPQIAASGTNVYVVWSDSGSGNYDIHFKKSTDGGTTFSSSTINISNNAGSSTFPQIAVSGTNYVYVTWVDNTSGNQETYFSRSTDGGATFSTPVNLSNTAGYTQNSILLQASGSNVYVAWTDTINPDFTNYDILFVRSTNNGATFGATTNLSSNTSASKDPAMYVSGSTVVVVWSDRISTTVEDIFLRKSTDGGATFSTATNVSTTSNGFSYMPQIAGYGNTLYVAWHDNTPGAYDVFLRKSTDGGATFGSSPINISNDPSTSTQAKISVSGTGSVVNIIWLDLGMTKDIFFKQSTNGGSSFAAATNISNTPGISQQPQITSSGTTPYVIWDDNSPTGKYDVFIMT